MRHLAVLSLVLALASPAAAADPAHPVVVELFQSQGCSSCPPANATLNAIAGRSDILALSFAVTYWDRLGWKDSFASPAYTARQWDYARAGGRGEVATPQMIIDGQTVLNGGNQREVEAVVARRGRGSAGPPIAAAAGKIAIGPGTTSRAATVWLVRYDPRVQNVAIRAGENGGRTLPHRNIVRSIEALGQWRGAPLSLTLPTAADPGYRTAILIQSGKGGPIVAAAKF
jgi:hypothetical protein